MFFGSFPSLSQICKNIHVNVYHTYSKVLTRHRVQRVVLTYSKVPTRHRVQSIVLRTSLVILSEIRRTKSFPSDLFCYSLKDSSYKELSFGPLIPHHRVHRVVLRIPFVTFSLISKDIHVNMYSTYIKVPTRHRVQRVVLRTSCCYSLQD